MALLPHPHLLPIAVPPQAWVLLQVRILNYRQLPLRIYVVWMWVVLVFHLVLGMMIGNAIVIGRMMRRRRVGRRKVRENLNGLDLDY